MTTHAAWAIDSNSKEGHGLLGQYWWFEGRPVDVPAHLKGTRTALFRTRQDARKALKAVRRGYSYPAARVVKVRVTIETV